MPSFERCVVLVADDELTVLRIVTYALTRHRYDVIPVQDGPTALRVCREREGPIHLALLDVIMPVMTGPELFECLLNLHPKIAVHVGLPARAPSSNGDPGCALHSEALLSEGSGPAS
jgi:CheY-like chemotaxis protein